MGYDPTYGARPLKRAIQKHLENPLAQEILAGRIAQGDTVRGDTGGEGGELRFEVVAGSSPAEGAETRIEA